MTTNSQIFQIRCSSEEKKIFHEYLSKSGMSAAKFFMNAVNLFVDKTLEEEKNSIESLKIYGEIDNLTGRLNQLVKAQICIVNEYQNQMIFENQAIKKKNIELEKENENLHENLKNEYDSLLASLQRDLEEKNRIIEKNSLVFNEKIEEYKKKNEEYIEQLNITKEFFSILKNELQEEKNRVKLLEDILEEKENEIKKYRKIEVQYAVLEDRLKNNIRIDKN